MARRFNPSWLDAARGIFAAHELARRGIFAAHALARRGIFAADEMAGLDGPSFSPDIWGTLGRKYVYPTKVLITNHI